MSRTAQPYWQFVAPYGNAILLKSVHPRQEGSVNDDGDDDNDNVDNNDNLNVDEDDVDNVNNNGNDDNVNDDLLPPQEELKVNQVAC